MKKVITEIYKNVTPADTVKKSKKQIAETVLDLVKKEIIKFPEVLGLEFGGSYAKGTWLSKDADIDVFIRIKKSTSNKRFEEIGKKIGFDSMKKFSPYVRYSQHPYVEAKIKDTKINIVPFYDVEIGEWISAADRSTFHTKFMKKSLTEKMRNEVRVLKLFLKVNGIYGAEIAKQGFSGYVSEVMILHFGTFENTVKSISEFKEKEIIGKTSKKFETPITIVDPIDHNRNLAAAISNENLGKLILISRAFRKKPTLKFFKKNKSRVSKNFWENLLVIRFNFKNRSPDVIWGQIKRAATLLSTQLELGGFEVLRSMSYTDQQKDAYLFFLLESTKISKIYVKKGPEFFRKDSCDSFIGKNVSSSDLLWVGNDMRISSLVKRDNPEAVKFITEFLKSNIKTCIPKGIQDDFQQGFKVSVGEKKLSESIKEEASKMISTDDSFLYFN